MKTVGLKKEFLQERAAIQSKTKKSIYQLFPSMERLKTINGMLKLFSSSRSISILTAMIESWLKIKIRKNRSKIIGSPSLSLKVFKRNRGQRTPSHSMMAAYLARGFLRVG